MIVTDLEPIVTKYPAGRRDVLIPLLQEVQDAHGYLSRDAVVRIGRHLRLPASKVYGVATFYNQFRFQPLGRFHVQVCRGTACHVKGSPEHARRDRSERSRSRPARRRRTGSSASRWSRAWAPAAWRRVMAVNGEFYAGATSERVGRILSGFRREAAKK